MSTLTLQGEPTFHHKKWKGIKRSAAIPIQLPHCQEILTREDNVNSLHLQALHWADNGDLIAADRFTLLNSLLPQSLPEVQLELIRSIECLPVDDRTLTAQVSES